MLSINGQAISAVYGNDRTKYDVVCGVQSATFNAASESNPRLTAARYVAEGGGKTPASAWATCVACTTYIDSLMVLDVNQEVPLAISWQTANEATRQTLYASYWASNSANDMSPLPATTSLYVSYQTWLAWAVANGVNHLTPYETNH